MIDNAKARPKQTYVIRAGFPRRYRICITAFTKNAVGSESTIGYRFQLLHE